MREPLDEARLRRFLDALGRSVRTSGGLYLTGGATALLHGWRSATIDVDIKFDPEPAGAFEAIARLKEELRMNVELASPDLFVPELPDWRDHSPFIGRFGNLDVWHYDLRAQALAKIARDHERDRIDVTALLERRLVTRAALGRAFAVMEPRLLRYPRLDAARFANKVASWVADGESSP